MPSTGVLAVVDDDASVGQATAQLIRCFGFAVEVFASGEEFLHLGSLRDTSCLILDVHMPGMSGVQVQSRLAALGYRIPIIFITAYSREGLRERALAAGAVDFLQKPFSEEALLRGIRSALEFGAKDGRC